MRLARLLSVFLSTFPFTTALISVTFLSPCSPVMPVIAGRLHCLPEDGFHLGEVGGILLIALVDLRPLLLLLLSFCLLLLASPLLQLCRQRSDLPGSQIPGDDLPAHPFLLHVVKTAALPSFPSHRFSVLLCYTPALAPLYRPSRFPFLAYSLPIVQESDNSNISNKNPPPPSQTGCLCRISVVGFYVRLARYPTSKTRQGGNFSLSCFVPPVGFVGIVGFFPYNGIRSQVQHLLLLALHDLTDGQRAVLGIRRDQQAGLMQTLKEHGRRQSDPFPALIAQALRHIIGHVLLQIQVLALYPADPLPVGLPLVALMLPGADHLQTPAPGDRSVRLVPLRRRHMRPTAGNRRLQQIQEPLRRLAGLLMARLRVRRSDQCPPAPSPADIQLGCTDNPGRFGKAQEAVPAERQVRGNLRRAPVQGIGGDLRPPCLYLRRQLGSGFFIAGRQPLHEGGQAGGIQARRRVLLARG